MADAKSTTRGPKPRKSRKRPSEQTSNEPQRSVAAFVDPKADTVVGDKFHSQVAQSPDTQDFLLVMTTLTAMLRSRVGDDLAYEIWLKTFPKAPGAPRGPHDAAFDQLLDGAYQEQRKAHPERSEIEIIRELHKVFSKPLGNVTVQAIERRLERIRRRKQH